MVKRTRVHRVSQRERRQQRTFKQASGQAKETGEDEDKRWEGDASGKEINQPCDEPDNVSYQTKATCPLKS